MQAKYMNNGQRLTPTSDYGTRWHRW